MRTWRAGQGQALFRRHHRQHDSHVAAGGIAHEDNVARPGLAEYGAVGRHGHAEHVVEIMLRGEGIDRHGNARAGALREIGDQLPMIARDLEAVGSTDVARRALPGDDVVDRMAVDLTPCNRHAARHRSRRQMGLPLPRPGNPVVQPLGAREPLLAGELQIMTNQTALQARHRHSDRYGINQDPSAEIVKPDQYPGRQPASDERLPSNDDGQLRFRRAARSSRDLRRGVASSPASSPRGECSGSATAAAR